MVDLRPLLFINALLVMLLVTAGFATHQSGPGATQENAASQDMAAASQQKTTVQASNIPATDDLAGELEQFRPTDDAPADTVEEAILFVDQLSPAQQKERDNEQIAAEAGVSAAADQSVLVASLDQQVPETTATQITKAEAPAKPEPVVEKAPELPTTGRLYVRSNVTRDKVLINGKSYGSSAVDVELPAGEYEVAVSKEGYKTWRRTVDLGRGDRRSLSVTLDRITVVQYVDGVWKQGVVTGQGSYKGADGTVYRGDFVNKLFHGRGELILADGTNYSGEWVEGRKHGLGTLSKSNGDSYTGEFKGDEFNGQGTLTLANGDIYTGYWVDGKLNGQGTYTAKDGTLYVGGFSDNKYHGSGSLTFADGSYYEGGFANGEFQGKGELVYADGKKYSGQFFEGKFHGQGELQNPNGSSISGTFKFGKPFGMATLTTPEGEIFTARSSEPGVCYRLKSYRATQCPPMEGW